MTDLLPSLKVLVATDGSDAAIDAAHRAVALLRTEAEIVLLMVIPDKEDPMDTAGGFEGPAITEEEAEAQFEHDTEAGAAVLDRTAEALAAEAQAAHEAVSTRLLPVDEDPGKAIVEVAAELGTDVIVVGAAGKGFFRRVFSGSVSDYVVHHAHCPVLVVRHDH